MSQRFSTHAPGPVDAPVWLWLIVPAVAYPLVIASIFMGDFYSFLMRKEGAIEYLAVVILLIGVGYGVALLKNYRSVLPRRWLVWWLSIATLGTFVFAGEEVSWGQHLGFWTSEQLPEALKAINDQHETNLHNMSNKLDQLPNNIIVLGTFFAYVLLPLHLKRRNQTMGYDDPGYWFWPTRTGLLAAIGVLVIPFPKRIYEWTTGQSAPVTLRHSELQEFYIAVLMTIYLVSVYRRARWLALQRSSEGQPVAETEPAEPTRVAVLTPYEGWWCCVQATSGNGVICCKSG